MLILASASPRRSELLKNAGIQFVIRPANIAEIRFEGEGARAFAERMAKEKARAVWEQIQKPVTTKATKLREEKKGSVIVLGADTVVVVDDQVLGKPEDEADADRMLRLISGREHRVITGVCLIGESFEALRSEVTKVQFSQIPADEIGAYIASREPMDKAGAYAIQGLASRWISKIEGDYSNVVGLPVELVRRILRERGLSRD